MADAGVSVRAHVERILASVVPLDPLTVSLADALGLVSAVDIVAPLALPRFDHAAMDGYAVRAADLASEPSVLPVAGVVAAGDATKPTLHPGTAWRIMTGAPVPAGADAVVPFEWTDRGDDRVRVDRSISVGQHIRRQGEDVLADDVAVLAGTELAPRHLALLAAVGVADVTAHPAPRVALIATGEELVSGEVPDSNTTAIAAAGRAIGAQVVSHGPVPDDRARLLQRLAEAAGSADLVVTTGGVSTGDHDVVKAALAALPDFWFGSVAVKPGRPQGAGVVTSPDGRRVPVICLPGTPVAAFTSFRLFAEPAIRVLAGRPPDARTTAILDAPVEVSADRTLVLPATYVGPGRVAQLAGHVGHSQRLLAAADVLLVVPAGSDPVPAGSEVEVLPLG
jgi:molybdopterin molybdotransferase